MCCRGCWLQNIFQNFQQQCLGILFVHKYGTTDRRETCVAKYNWWWVYYQNIVTYLKCVLEAPLLYYYIVLIHCSNPLQLVDCVEWGLLLYGLVISTAVGSSPAHGPARLVPVCMVIYFCTIVRRSGVHAVFPCGSCNVLHSSDIERDGNEMNADRQ